MTNCKRGDVAMYVGRHEAARGMVVRCVRAMTSLDKLQPQNREVVMPAWLIDPPLRRDDGSTAVFASDMSLRPLRDSDDEDETLRLVGRPHQEL